MVMLLYMDCPCCRKFAKTGDFWHCEYCWNKNHNGLRDKDFLTREEFDKTHENMKEIKNDRI